MANQFNEIAEDIGGSFSDWRCHVLQASNLTDRGEEHSQLVEGSKCREKSIRVAVPGLSKDMFVSLVTRLEFALLERILASSRTRQLAKAVDAQSLPPCTRPSILLPNDQIWRPKNWAAPRTRSQSLPLRGMWIRRSSEMNWR
jgi:hypothetical protein